MSIMQTVLHSPHFMVIDHVCRRPRVDCGAPQGDEPARFIFTRRGSFTVHVQGRSYLARPGNAVLVGRHVEYRISHAEREGCDCCTDVWLDEGMLDSLGMAGAASPPARDFPHDLAFQKTHVEMLLGLRRARGAATDAEDVLVDALAQLVRTTARPKGGLRCHVAKARQVARVEEAIIGHAGENLDVGLLAGLAGCSPFHLCRIFRERTGQSLRQFRLYQRIGTALGRLGEGETDLAALACDVGFSSHSHMTEAFRQTLGCSPRDVRDDFRRSDLARLKLRLRAMALSALRRESLSV